MRELLESAIERILGDVVSPAVFRECAVGAWPSELWDAIEDAELTRAAVPEALGGAGATWEDSYILVRSAGAHAVPAPFADSVLANWMLSRVGLKPAPGPSAIAASARLFYSSGRVTGKIEWVPWGHKLKHVIALTAGSEPQLVVVDASHASSVDRRTNLAGEPRDTLNFESVRVVDAAPLPRGMSADELLLGGAMLRSAQIAGALHSVLQMTAAYATERVQFGKPIGDFQAIQQQLAVLAEHTASSLLSAEAAFAESERTLAALAIMAAKICASEAASIGASIAHAVHGAIGFTDEHGLHLRTRRLWAWRAEYGSETYWSQRLGRQACESGASALWPMLTQSAEPGPAL
jgi:acyl-CoA dehydrogenase